MDDGLKKKLLAAAAAAVAAFAFGESQISSIDSRLAALEGLHPEIVTSVPQDTEESPPALGKPGISAPPTEAPEHLELNEDDEWVPVEESSEEPVEEVSEEVEESCSSG